MSWIQIGSDIDGEAAQDFSGYSVSLNSAGDVVAIGAGGNDGSHNAGGHVRVYSWNGTSWTQRGNDIDGEAAQDFSGYSVSLNSAGDVVAIGAPGNDANSPETDIGSVRIYSWDGTTWTQWGMDIDGEAAYDRSGWSLSLNSSGDIVAIGAINNSGGGGNSGHVRVYSWTGSVWAKLGNDIDGEAADDNSGFSVSLNSAGDIVAIGAEVNDGNGINSGHVRVYVWNGTSWNQRGNDINGESAGDYSGYSVSLNANGDLLAIGAILNDGNGTSSGHVRVYVWNGSNWVQRGSDINGEAGGDGSGASVSLSSDGNILAIGAIYNDGNGSNSGHVRIYYWNGSNWVQRGSDINGEAGGDESGTSVSLSSNGNILAIGARYNGGNGTESGHVRVYSFIEPTTTTTTTTTTTVAPTTTTNLLVWGDNTYGQLGDGTTIQRNVPTAIANSWKSISASFRNSSGAYTIAIDNNDRLWSWGDNTYGQLGDGTTTQRLYPVQIGFDTWKSISTGDRYSLAIKNNNTLWAWGSGILGNGVVTQSNSPIQIGSSTWKTVSCGGYHALAIRSDNTLWAWGYNFDGQIGDGTFINKLSPVQIGISAWNSISAGLLHSLAIRSNGTLWGWGYNLTGAIGDGTTAQRLSPVQIGVNAWKAIDAGSYHSLAIKSDNTLWAWGDNFSGGIGDGTTTQRLSPVQIGTNSWNYIAGGNSHSLAIRNDNTLWAWGNNSLGQLGDGTNTQRLSPIQIGSNIWNNISAGNLYSLGIISGQTTTTVTPTTTTQAPTTTTTTTSIPQTDATYFKIINDRLYINSKVLDFNMPSKVYGVRINLLDENNNVISYKDQYINIITCPCNNQ